MRSTTRILASLAIVSSICVASALAQESPITPNDQLEAIRQENHIPGLSGTIIRGSEIVWQQQSGLANLEQDVPVTADSRFRLGSVSKVVTATLAARLAESGQIDLDAPISEYLSDLPVHHSGTTLRQLLTHQGGIRHYTPADYNPAAPGGMIDQRIYRNIGDALSLFINDDLVAAPGTQFHYSTYGYTLAAAVMEAATGQSYGDLVNTWIAAPLGLTSLTLDDPFAVIPGRVSFYDPAMLYRQQLGLELQGSLVNALPANPAYKWAGGGLLSNASDLARFGAALAHPGYLSPRSHEMMFTTAQTNDGQSTAVGLGWNVDRDTDGRLRYHHAGLQQGTRTVLLVYPEHDISIALMSNLGGMPQDILAAAAHLAQPWLD